MWNEKKLETLQELQARVGTYNRTSLPVHGGMDTNSNLWKKVDEFGNMKTFIGNTTVFLLPEEVKAKIHTIQNKLYEACPDVFAEPLVANTFHITLHDLLNGEESEDLRWKMGEIEGRAKELVRQIGDRNEEIRLKSSVLFSMVSTSMVLGFEPVDEESCQRIMEYHRLFQELVYLNYSLTPHITVAYYRPCRIHTEQVKKLQEVIDWVNTQEPIEVTLSSKMLEYQIFFNMNHYINSAK
mgnify:FL=1